MMKIMMIMMTMMQLYKIPLNSMLKQVHQHVQNVKRLLTHLGPCLPVSLCTAAHTHLNVQKLLYSPQISSKFCEKQIIQ